jgi:hypothetical protein
MADEKTGVKKEEDNEFERDDLFLADLVDAVETKVERVYKTKTAPAAWTKVRRVPVVYRSALDKTRDETLAFYRRKQAMKALGGAHRPLHADAKNVYINNVVCEVQFPFKFDLRDLTKLHQELQAHCAKPDDAVLYRGSRIRFWLQVSCRRPVVITEHGKLICFMNYNEEDALVTLQEACDFLEKFLYTEEEKPLYTWLGKIDKANAKIRVKAHISFELGFLVSLKDLDPLINSKEESQKKDAKHLVLVGEYQPEGSAVFQFSIQQGAVKYTVTVSTHGKVVLLDAPSREEVNYLMDTFLVDFRASVRH